MAWQGMSVSVPEGPRLKRLKGASSKDPEVKEVSSLRVLKLIISIAFLCVCTARDTFLFFRSGRRRGYCIILYYHAVARENRVRFARQMDLLLRWAKPVAANRTEICRPGERCAAVTFDDGLESVVENALPELERRNIPATLFIVAQSLGRPPIWMPASRDSLNAERVISVEQLRKLPSDLVVIGSHSLTHPNLNELELANARREICDSRTQLREILGRDVSLFSFPYGAFSEPLIQCCRDAGYERVFTTLPTLALNAPGEFVSGRVTVEPTDWPLEFHLKILGAYRWLPAAFALKRTLKSISVRSQDSRLQTESQNDREVEGRRLSEGEGLDGRP